MSGPEVNTEGQRLLLEEPDSLRKVAERIGCTKQLVSYWRNGKRLPSPDKMRALEEAYQIPARAWVTLPGGTLSGEAVAIPTEGGAPASAANWETLPPTLAHTNELLLEVRAHRRERGLTARERMKLIDQEGKLIGVKARLEREQELLEDRIVRDHPEWHRLRRLLVEALRPFPEAASAVREALERVDP